MMDSNEPASDDGPTREGSRRTSRHEDGETAHRRRLAIESLDLSVPADLPIAAHRDAIVDLLRQRSTIVVSGETGSGKSTQLPKLCLAAGLGQTGLIGHTQPRRLAAQSIASRLAEELQTPLGEHVGFKIRFTDRTRPETLVKLMTDGILLAETQSDRDLNAYDAVIIDEAHERSLNIDFLLGYLKRLRQIRPRLRTIITSATIDAERFSEHFADDSGPAPIVVVEGRSYPVEIRYRPWEELSSSESDGENRNYDLARHVIDGIDEVIGCGPGDVLVFLPTERDIREVSHRVGGHLRRTGRLGQIDLLPLYARLPQSEQTKIFNPKGSLRRIIFATNVAESSLTVPGIRYVVDAGLARISRYSPRSKVQRLPIEPVSQASARQRAGRCGRVAAGVCVRLFSAEDFESRDAYTTPEIRRTGLASVILQTKILRLGSVDEFPFLDPPRPEAVREGYRTLFEIGALDDRRRLTAIGRRLGRLPVDPRVGRMILAAIENGVLPEILVIAAGLEIQDPRERPPDKKQAADQAQSIFQDANSDFLSYLKIWRFYHQQRETLSRNQLQKACRYRFLSYQRLRQWSDVYRQLRDMVRALRVERTSGIAEPRVDVDFENPQHPIMDANRYQLVHQSLLAGLLSGVAMLGDNSEYTGAGNLKLFLWPGSGVFASKPKWIVAAELVETSKQFARCVARIQPEWIETVAPHLTKASYSDPHWGAKQAGAFCYQRVTLFGLPIVTRRKLPLAPIDPTTARTLLIQHGLVQQEMPTRARFVDHNRRLQQSIADLAAKTRRRDLVVDAYALENFYDDRLPPDVVDRARLEKWDRDLPPPTWAKRLKDAGDLARWMEAPPPIDESDNQTPYLRPEILTGQFTTDLRAEAFPDSLQVGETRLPLEYRYEPGAGDDGVTVTIPKAALAQVSDHRLGWLVPGLLEDKVLALIKSLPKRIRRNLVPAADTARRVVSNLDQDAGNVPFMPTVCQLLSQLAEMPISPHDFDQSKLADHLHFHVRVVDDEGKPLASGRSIAAVREDLQLTDGDEDDSLPDSDDGADIEAKGWTTFAAEDLPAEAIRVRGGVRVAHFPALVDTGNAVDVRYFGQRAVAEVAHHRGLTRLFAIAEKKEIRSQVRWLPDLERSRMLMAHRIPAGEFESQLSDLVARRGFVDGEPIIRTRNEFESRRSERGKRIAIAIQEIAQWLPDLATAIHSVRVLLESATAAHLQYAVQDVGDQVSALLIEDFIRDTPWNWLEQYPRYFRAIEYRFDKLRSGNLDRDREWTQMVNDFRQRIGQAEDPADESRTQKSEELRWMLEELRVSLFAQPLGTAIKISPQRIEKMLRG
jgi:ATP-dependent helicase HrpA